MTTFIPNTQDIINLNDILAEHHMTQSDEWGFYKSEAYKWSEGVLSAWMTARCIDAILEHDNLRSFRVREDTWNQGQEHGYDISVVLRWRDGELAEHFDLREEDLKDLSLSEPFKNLIQNFFDQAFMWHENRKNYSLPQAWHKNEQHEFTPSCSSFLSGKDPEASALIERYFLQKYFPEKDNARKHNKL